MKKGIWIATASALGFAFTTAAAIDFNGYNVFDRADGSNALCSADPDCRNLSDDEIALAKTIFGNTIDYPHIKIFTRDVVLWRKPENVAARMWNGNIYLYDERLKVPDLSREARLENQKTFLHEMTHVWQYSNDPKFLATGFFNLLLHDFVYNALYNYQIDDHREFSAFNFEQQGDIIEDYFALRTKFTEQTAGLTMDRPRDFKKSFNQWGRATCQKLDQYTSVISYSLPQKPESKCDMYRPYVIFPVDPARDDPLPPLPPPINLNLN